MRKNENVNIENIRKNLGLDYNFVLQFAEEQIRKTQELINRKLTKNEINKLLRQIEVFLTSNKNSKRNRGPPLK